MNDGLETSYCRVCRRISIVTGPESDAVPKRRRVPLTQDRDSCRRRGLSNAHTNRSSRNGSPSWRIRGDDRREVDLAAQISANILLTRRLVSDNICPNQVVHTRQLDLAFRSWGGRRRGAGRKASPGRRAVPRRRRHTHDPRVPVHVTLRASRGLLSLREARIFQVVRTALADASRGAFRVLHFSVQADHVHLLVEADAHSALVRGLQGLAIRLARAVNRLLGRRAGVWSHRYHARQLRTPREVRHALVYVLNNWRKHLPGARGLDPCSSAPWFTGWRPPVTVVGGATPVVAARTWLLRVAWRRYGPIDIEEAPRPRGRSR